MRYLIIILLLVPQMAYARPVSYPGGWTVMQNNDYSMNSLHIHYSPTAKESIGWKAEYNRDEDFQLQMAQYNRLLKRWNMEDAQANAYLKLGLGIAEQEGDVDPATTIGFASDYETRRIFASYENRYLKAGSFSDAFTQKARVGVAPYLGEYDDLQTWLMLEVAHDPEGRDEFVTTPLVRFFKDEYMAEIGFSSQKDLLFNWVIRF